jgi:hypothetical protein
MDSVLAIYRERFWTMRGIKAMAANATKHWIFHRGGIFGLIRGDCVVGSV